VANTSELTMAVDLPILTIARMDAVSKYSPRLATAIPATNATTTIFRCVARSAQCIEWFIDGPRLCKHQNAR
jgi:hypothetical protein